MRPRPNKDCRATATTTTIIIIINALLHKSGFDLALLGSFISLLDSFPVRPSVSLYEEIRKPQIGFSLNLAFEYQIRRSIPILG
jgi:hypothetical protein